MVIMEAHHPQPSQGSQMMPTLIFQLTGNRRKTTCVLSPLSPRQMKYAQNLSEGEARRWGREGSEQGREEGRKRNVPQTKDM